MTRNQSICRILIAVCLATSSRTASAATIGYWRFENGTPNTTVTAAIDSGPYGISLFPSSTPTYRTDSPGLGSRSVEFDGSDGLSAADDNRLDFGATDSFTVELFFQTTTTAERGLMQKQQGFSGTQLYQIFMDHGNVYFDIRDNSTSHLTRTTSPLDYNDGQWHHVAGVRDVAADEIRLYVDGQFVDSATDITTGSLANSGTLWLGVGNTGSSAYTFPGKLDEFRISNVALLPSQFLNAQPVPEPSTISLAAAGACLLSVFVCGKPRRRRANPGAPAPVTVPRAKAALRRTDRSDQ
ncbi:MAG: LamG domain-containing protein [Pirellulales bacterium]|nr:LamG domain-containing protein [Pirellulales bacterium]